MCFAAVTNETLINLQDDTFSGLVRSLPRPDDPADEPVQSDEASHAATMLVPADGTAVDRLPDELVDHPRYLIGELIGRGGMGSVYRAEHKLMNRPVAVKLINSQLVTNSQAVERFQREFQAAAQLTHRNIVTAYDAEQAGDVHFLAMEFVDGTDLASVVDERGPLPVGEASRYIAQAAQGLQHAYEKRMVHRDIKPHNLMLDTEGQVRILDFGLAGFAAESALTAAESEDAETVDYAGRSLTNLGCVMGTPDYMAPEQARDAHSADIRADIYSLGCTLYFLLTGQPPHADGTVAEKLHAHALKEPLVINDIRPAGTGRRDPSHDGEGSWGAVSDSRRPGRRAGSVRRPASKRRWRGR